MDPSEELSRSLVKWLQTLTPKGTKTLAEISDGVAICQVLIQIDQQHFGRLESKIKGGSDWRLKISNLKKIVESVVEYYQDVLDSNVLDVGRPDVHKIGETNNLVQLGKLLRLVLGCAVNCDKRQEYITQIVTLEVAVQQSIMQAIEELEDITGKPSIIPDERLMLIQELEAVKEARMVLELQYQQLESQNQNLAEDKQALLVEKERLTSQISKQTLPDSIRSPDRRQIELLKDEIFKLETSRDDYRAKAQELEKQILLQQEKISELQLASKEISRLKDELDALKEQAEKVQPLENALASCKKKLEAHGDLKKQLMLAEDKSEEYYQQILKYEEDLKNNTVVKSQCEIYKNQVADLQQKLDEEINRADRATFQIKTLESKYTAVVGEKERLAQERAALREENEELKLGKPISKEGDGADLNVELAPTEMKQRLRFLEKENRTLTAAAEEAGTKQLLLDDALSRIDKLTEQNRNINQKVLELEAQVQESRSPRDSSNEGSIKEYKQKITTLKEALMAKEIEVQALQAKHMRNLERAREIAQSLEVKSAEDIESFRQNHMKEIEDQMLTVAFYRLSLNRHREAVDERLAMLSAGQGQSFLARQRQPMPRKPVQPFKSK